MIFTFIFALIAVVSAEGPCDEFIGILGKGDLLKTASVDEAFACIETFELTAETKTTIMNAFTKIMDAYIFKDILKSPVQPEEYPDYYETVDIDATLANITETNYTNFYEFFNDIHKMIVKTRDGHLSFTITGDNMNELFNALPMFYYYLPFDMAFAGGSTLLVPNGNAVQYGVELPPEVEANQRNNVESINNEAPEEFVKKFAEKYTRMRSPHAKFTEARTTVSFGTLGSAPLDRAYLNESIVVKYAGVDNTVTYNYGMAFVNLAAMSQAAQRKHAQHLAGKEKTILRMEDIFETEEMYLKKQSLKRETPRFAEEGNDIYCFVDDTAEINTLVLTTFSPDDDVKAQFEQTILSCMNKFYENGYKIQIILPKNGGGYVSLGQTIEKMLAPFDDVSAIGDLRVSELSEHLIKKGEYGKSVMDPETCKPREQPGELETIGKWYTEPREVEYEDATHKTSQLSVFGFPDDAYAAAIPFAKKPTEIVVYTDSYCYSCCSILTKGLKEHGSAIIVGFDGDPLEGGTEKFEVGQSPTSVETYKDYFPNDAFTNLGLSVGFSFYETFRYNYNYNETVPREFLIDEVDERFDFPMYDDSFLERFTANTLAVLEKYKTECNPKNKRLMKIDAACDAAAKKIDAHGLGGYLCGDNGEWTTTCDIARCEMGYHFDYKSKKCVESACMTPKEPGSENPEDSGNDKPEESGNDKPEDSGNDKPQESENNKPQESGNDKPEDSGNDKPEESGNDKPEDSENNKPQESGNDKPQESENNKPAESGNNKPEDSDDNTGGASSVMILFMMAVLFFIF